jgi:hypothetical protein
MERRVHPREAPPEEASRPKLLTPIREICDAEGFVISLDD